MVCSAPNRIENWRLDIIEIKGIECRISQGNHNYAEDRSKILLTSDVSALRQVTKLASTSSELPHSQLLWMILQAQQLLAIDKYECHIIHLQVLIRHVNDDGICLII